MDSVGKRGSWTKVANLLYAHPECNKQDDLTVVAVKDGKDDTILLASCYMPHDEEAPPNELRRLVGEAEKAKRPLIIGADANAHNTVWGSGDTNERGESLLNFILISNLDIANRGEEPTYIGPTSKNVLDITLHTSGGIGVQNWEVLSTPSFSDHRYVGFQVKFSARTKSETFRNHRNTNWELYERVVRKNLTKHRVSDSHSELEELTLEKILDAYIRDKLPSASISKAQHAYTKGRSTETALHSLTAVIEKALEHKEYALGVFLDISGAFNNVSYEAIMESLEAAQKKDTKLY
ncbi:uncharacterized protein LOC118740039 [Rhagoletis pomonella]|uniref:uncharacterized protein LOC118740039 n=1 Tax=Rhagoletis pomonella TaxID=28610 RepID=UPI0017804CF7|nr:uncharacterized protein LOC118740039 [Rhagoletis pomonella]